MKPANTMLYAGLGLLAIGAALSGVGLVVRLLPPPAQANHQTTPAGRTLHLDYFQDQKGNCYAYLDSGVYGGSVRSITRVSPAECR